MTTAPQPNFASLSGQHYANLTTFRRDGREVVTPVWFVLINDRAYVMTQLSSGKAKRLRHNPAARLAACNARGKVLGPSINVMGRQCTENEQIKVDSALDAKYGFMKKCITFIHTLRGKVSQNIYLEFCIAGNI